ncbi:Hypothetical predicted protein [Pelobates cultripes]|uniref:Uncharacterized protein n=1 Tax=Pelobates cultripes TaxID=61616 RepID=A0AAD1RPE7_PELCU|nr:Hypothetical predicted protein [Pelobates cultripes]
MEPSFPPSQAPGKQTRTYNSPYPNGGPSSHKFTQHPHAPISKKVDIREYPDGTTLLPKYIAFSQTHQMSARNAPNRRRPSHTSSGTARSCNDTGQTLR